MVDRTCHVHRRRRRRRRSVVDKLVRCCQQQTSGRRVCIMFVVGGPRAGLTIVPIVSWHGPHRWGPRND